MLGQAIVDQVKKSRAWETQTQADHDAWIKARESEGYVVVDGGQLSAPDAEGKSDWEFHDWRTGEALAHGHSTYDEVFFDSKWIHVDRFWDYTEAEDDEQGRPALNEPGTMLPAELEAFLSNLDFSEDFEDWVMNQTGHIEHATQ